MYSTYALCLSACFLTSLQVWPLAEVGGVVAARYQKPSHDRGQHAEARWVGCSQQWCGLPACLLGSCMRLTLLATTTAVTAADPRRPTRLIALELLSFGQRLTAVGEIDAVCTPYMDPSVTPV